MSKNGSPRPPSSEAIDVEVSHPRGGRMHLASRALFTDPSSDLCQRFVDRLFEVEEVRAIEIRPHAAWARIDYANGVVPSRHVIGKIARHLSRAPNGHRAPYVNSTADLPLASPEAVDGWRVERHGPVLSTWEIAHELPGRIRFRNQLIRGQKRACAAIERALMRALGIERCRANARTATTLVVFDPAKIERQGLLRMLDRALIDAEHAPPSVSLEAREGHGTAQIEAGRPRSWSGGEFSVSLLSVVAAGIGDLFFTPLSLLSAGGKLYVSRRMYVSSFWSMVRDRAITVDTTVILLHVVSLIHGYYFLFCLAGFMQLVTRNVVARVKQDSRADYADVFQRQTRTVWVRVDDVEVEMPLERVKAGDLVTISAGQTIPVDGHVVEGTASVDQHLLTGEAQPAEKGVGDVVLALTVVLAGQIWVRVEKTGSATVAAEIVRVLDRTVDFKTGRQLGAERVADRLVMPALLSGLVAWPFLGFSAGAGLTDTHPKYKTTLMSSLGLLNYFKRAVREGLLIKDGRTLELLNTVDTVVFDKTGTLTLAQPHIGRLYVGARHTADEILSLAAAAEQHQSHPIAAAILQEARGRRLAIPPTRDADYKVGYGLTVTIEGATIRVGSMRFMQMEAIAVPPALAAIQTRSNEAAHSLMVLAVDDEIAGAIELHSTVRPEAVRIVAGLRQRGITSMYIISGDHEAPTRRLAETLGIEHYFAGTLPQNKAALIERLQEEGKVVCYVGDGINDSIAMKKSHVSVSLRGASTLATETAEVILLDGTLNQLCRLFDLARACNRHMWTTMTPIYVASLIGIVGVLFGGFTFLHSRVLHLASLAVGVGTGMLPALTHAKAPERMDPPSLPAPPVVIPVEEVFAARY